MEARKAISLESKVKKTSLPDFSNYKFCEKFFNNSKTLKRILSQMRQHKYKSMVIEKINLTEEMQIENSLFSSFLKKEKKEFDFDKNAYRLSFFKRELNVLDEVMNLDNKDFLGYCIIKKNVIDKKESSTIFEAVTKPINSEHNKYIHCKNTFEVLINNNKFNVEGTVFSEGNGYTNGCAHCSLKTILSLVKKDKIFEYSEINKIIIDVLGKKLNTKNRCSKLDMQDIKNVLEHEGFNIFAEDDPNYFQKYIYSSIESGLPGLLGFIFKGKDANNKHSNRHIVPIIGHYFEDSSWIPNADLGYFKGVKDHYYISSDSWTTGFILHDDNYGSHYILPINYINFRQVKLYWGMMYKGVSLDPVKIEPIAEICFEEILQALIRIIGADLPKEKEYEWFNRMVDNLKRKQLVFRTILLKKQEYINHLTNMKDSKNNKSISKKTITYLKEILPDNLWMIEISLIDLYAINNMKLGEIILKSDKSLSEEKLLKANRSFENFKKEFIDFILSIRFPRGFVLKVKNKSYYMYIKSDINSYSGIYIKN